MGAYANTVGRVLGRACGASVRGHGLSPYQVLDLMTLTPLHLRC